MSSTSNLPRRARRGDDQSAVQVFDHPEFGNIRIVEKDGEPWFVASDVAKALGYRDGSNMIRNVDEEDRGTTQIVRGTSGGNPNVAIINESGLYSAILSSRIPTAKQFKRWVTSEVLPSIRKHGMYGTPQTIEQMISDPDFAIQLLTTLKDERAARIEAEVQLATVNELRAKDAPKVERYEKFLDTDSSFGVRTVCRLLTDSSGVHPRQYVITDAIVDDLKWMYRSGKNGNLTCTIQAERDGYVETRQVGDWIHARVTAKGLDRLAEYMGLFVGRI